MPQANLLAVGNELLSGEIRDLNLYTLSRRLTRMGFKVLGAVVARDTTQSISDSLAFLLAQGPDVLICTGGLGPTEDDLTLAALAAALDRPLILDPEARRLVEIHYEQLLAQGYLEHRGPEAARAKMARIPQGATPLPNPMGTAPGIRLEHEATRIYVLPGVPKELDAIFEETLVPELRSAFDLGGWAEKSLRVHVDDEALVASPLEEVRGRHPDVYLKSLAQPFPSAGREGLRIIAAAQASDVERAQDAVRVALADLRRTLEEAGLRVSLAEELADRAGSSGGAA